MSARSPFSPLASIVFRDCLEDFFVVAPIRCRRRTLLTVERIRKLVRAVLRRPIDDHDDEGWTRSQPDRSQSSVDRSSVDGQRRPVIQYIRPDDASPN
jgi:hypothetical protein